MYRPDGWIIVKVNDDMYKVLGSWSGGYLDSDVWRINSGITKVEILDSGEYAIHGNSGSVYYCHPEGYGRLNVTSANIAYKLWTEHGCEMLHIDKVKEMYAKSEIPAEVDKG